MKIFLIYSIFIYVLIVKCEKYDFESIEKNIMKPIYCDLNCLDKKDPSNYKIMTSVYEYFGELQFNNFTKPLYELCIEKLGSNLLENIHTADDILNEKFLTTFRSTFYNKTKEIDNLKEKISILLQDLSLAYRFSDFEFFPQIDEFKTFAENNTERISIYNEPQKCEFTHSDGINTNLKILSKQVTVEFNKIGHKFLSTKIIEKKINYVDVKHLLYTLNLTSKLQSLFTKRALEKHCDTELTFFKLKNISKEEYCN